jgi:cell division protein FtsW
MKRTNFDIGLTIAISLLLLIGMVMVFSASAVRADLKHETPTYFFTKQLLWGFLAILLMVAFSRIDYKKYNQKNFMWILIGLSLLFLVLLFPLGTRINGALRWFRFGPLQFQPSELSRLAMVGFAAFYLTTFHDKLDNFLSGLFPILGVLFIHLILILLQPNLSTALMFVMISGALIFISRAKISHILTMVAPVVPVGLYIIGARPYQLRRIASWWQAITDPAQAPHQVKQSLIAMGCGGFFGQGIGQSRQKYLFLPDSHTDFIFSILGEELGLIGTTLILATFLYILYRGIRIANHTSDEFGKFLAIGLTLNIVLYAFINIAVVTMLMPATGLPMPFISYGGSNLLFLGVGVGILINISRQTSAAPSGLNTHGFKNQNSRFNRPAYTVG